MRNFILAMLLVSIACEPVLIHEGKPSSHQSTNSTAEVLLKISASTFPLFIKVEADNDALAVAALTQHAFEECTTMNRLAICVLRNLVPEEVIKIDVFCLEDCNFTIEAYRNEYLSFKLQQEIGVTFRKDDDYLLAEIAVPEDLEFSSLHAIAVVNNPESVNGSLSLFASVAPKKPSPSEHDFKGEPVWGDGQGLFLSKDKLPPKSKLRVFLSGSKDMEIGLSCFWVSKQVMHISTGRSIYDDVDTGNSKMYVLDLGSLDEDSVTVKFTKYTGKSEVRITSDGNRANNKSLEGLVTDSLTQFQITREVREQLEIGNSCYIEVIGEQPSTYMLSSSVQSGKYILLDDDLTVVGSLIYGEAENYYYPLMASEEKKDADNVREFKLEADIAFGRDLFCGVRICEHFQEINGKCLVPDAAAGRHMVDKFSSIPASNHTDDSWIYSTFSYDIRKCHLKSEKRHLCLFHVACFNLPPVAKNAVTQYSLRFEQMSLQTTLSEGIVKRDRLHENQTRKYLFQLKNVEGVRQIKFSISTISGDCLMSAALDRRNHTFDNEQVRYAFNRSIKYDFDISKRYFLQVKAFTNTYYSLYVQVLRGSNTSPMELEPFQLKEGVIHNTKLDSLGEESRFLIRLKSPKRVYVQITSRHLVDFSVYSSKNMQPTEEYSQKGISNFLLISAPNQTATTFLEFVVVVHSRLSKHFSLVFNEWGKCAPTNINQHVQLNISEESSLRCFQFVLNRLAPLMIVATESYFDKGTGENMLFLQWNGAQQEILSKRATYYEPAQLLRLCPQLAGYSKGQQASCLLTMRIEAERVASLTIAVQYIDQEIELFDGLQVTMVSPLSRTTGAHFYYDIPDRTSPILISVRFSSNMRFELVWNILTLEEYYSAPTHSVYPKYQDRPVLISDISHPGSTVIVIKTPDLDKFEIGKDQLLISLFVDSVLESDAEFRIEVVQHTVPLRLTEMKTGFIAKGSVQKYSVSARSNEQLIVHLNTLVPYCVRLHLYNNDPQTKKDVLLKNSLSNQLIISSTADPKDYIIEIFGLDSCTFEISYTKASQKIYELELGHPFHLDFAAKELTYFLYFNIRNETFKLMELIDHGSLSFRAMSLLKANLSSLSKVIDEASKKEEWQYEEAHHDASLKIGQSSPDFCVNCYFLIEVKADVASSASLLIHNQNSPVLLRQNKYARDSLDAGEQTNYLYLKIAPLVMSFTVFTGTLRANISLTQDKTYGLTFNISESRDYLINYEGPTVEGDNAFQTEAFRINVVCEDHCVYALLLDSHGYPRTLASGIPYRLHVTSYIEPKCVQFISLQKNTSTHLFLSSPNISGVSYTVRCFQRFVWSPCQGVSDIILNNSTNEEGINLQLRSVDGVYLACLTLNSPNKTVNVTTLLSRNREFEYLSPSIYSPMTVSNFEPSIIVKMDSHENQSTIVEVFECSGEIQFSASSDYSKLSTDQDQDLIKYSKLAGHLVAALPFTDESDLDFGKISLKETRISNKANFLFRYSYYPTGENPFDSIELQGEEIQFTQNEDSVAFSLPVVTFSEPYAVLSAQYNIYVAKNFEDLKSGLCGTITVLSKSIKVEGKQGNSAELQFTRQEIAAFIGMEKQYFVGADCEVTAQLTTIPAGTPESTHTYRLSYNSLQMEISEVPSSFNWTLLLLIVAVVVILLLLLAAAKWGLARLRKKQSESFADENIVASTATMNQNDQSAAAQNAAAGTSKNLVTQAAHLVARTPDIHSRAQMLHKHPEV